MGVLASAERAIWQAATGSSHDHYRQALWRPTRQAIGSVSLSDPFEGIRGASGWNRRSWNQLGIVEVHNGELEELLARPGAKPAVGFTIGELLVVGELEGPDPFGHMTTVSGEQGNPAHGMRLGPGETQFGIGVIGARGHFITPSEQSVVTMGPVPIDQAMAPGSGFAAINFS